MPDAARRPDHDDDLVLVQRFLRAFLRATALNEDTIKQRLGKKAGHFLNELLPQLRHAGVVQEVAYHGGGRQRRLRLMAPMTRIERALRASPGVFHRFVDEIRRDVA